MRSNPPSSGCWLALLACLALGALAACTHPDRNGGGSGNGGSSGAGQGGSNGAGQGGSNGAGQGGNNGAGQGGDNGAGQGGSTGAGQGGSTGAGQGGSTGAGQGGSTGAGQGGATGAGQGGSSGGNLVTNGDFSNGESSWNVIPNGGGNPSHNTNNGQLCVNLGANQSVTLGWSSSGSPLMLSNGTRYRFSYRVSSSSGLTSFTAKVGQAVDPYTSDFETMVQPGSGLTPFMHDFTTDHPDTNTGIAFIANAGGSAADVCIDDVSLTTN